jgi:hypothetical protein
MNQKLADLGIPFMSSRPNLVKAYDSAKEQNQLMSESLGKDDTPSNADDANAQSQRQELEAWVDNALRKKSEDEV